MKLNFYPYMKRMTEEIERCIAVGKVDTLMSFCSSCFFMVLSNTFEPHCKSCVIYRGITAITGDLDAEDIRTDGLSNVS